MRTELPQRITIEEGKCGGRPCIRGKCMRVTDLLDLLSAGASMEEILADSPFLENEPGAIRHLVVPKTPGKSGDGDLVLTISAIPPGRMILAASTASARREAGECPKPA